VRSNILEIMGNRGDLRSPGSSRETSGRDRSRHGLSV